MKRSFCLVVIFLATQFLMAFLVTFVVNLPSLWRDGELNVSTLADNPSALGISMILTSIVVVAVMTALNWTERRGFQWRKVPPKAYWGAVILMIPAIYMVNVLTEKLSLEDVNQTLFAGLMSNFWGVLAIVLAGPFMEEIVFRMGIQRHLMRRHLFPWQAILMSAFIFGVIHGNPAQMPGAMLLGIVLGWLYWRSDCIWLSVTAHIFNNLIGVLTFWIPGLRDRQMSDLVYGGTWGLALSVVLAFLFFMIVYRWLNGMLRPEQSFMRRIRRRQ